ncbi:MAG: GDP-mannose 4,6-dehydratase, partial [Patescibacteria group bacterium]|nr:GDP-mannose 4,6-dehydratase [Patescibacteria group bacterium]
MKLLVTGGAGFIGTNFIKYWLEKHPADDIINFDKLTYAGNLENLKDLENNPRYKFIKGDIADPDDVRIAVQGIDTIVHFAAESHVDRSILSPATFVKTNILGTQVLLDAAVENKIKR